jgi:hypothetical protein
VVCVISDEYLKSPYSTLERNAALWQAAGKRPGFVLFVAVNPCKLPTLSDHIRRCELFGIPEDAARIRFREFMQKREAPVAIAFPGKVFAISNITIRVPEHFLGREDSLAAIETALNRYEGRVAITALHGCRASPDRCGSKALRVAGRASCEEPINLKRTTGYAELSAAQKRL